MVVGGMHGYGGCAWLCGGMRGCRGACMVAGGCGWGVCVFVGGHVWLKESFGGKCMVGGHAWLLGGVRRTR